MGLGFTVGFSGYFKFALVAYFFSLLLVILFAKPLRRQKLFTLASIRFAVERKTRGGDVLGAHQKLTRLEAYRKMTLDAARLNGTEGEEGSVEAGKYADFVVLNDNPLGYDVELTDDLVEMTIVNGKIVYGSRSGDQGAPRS